MVAEGFVDADARRQIGHDGDPAGLLDWLAAADVRRPG
jgi:hypothetical protein